MVQFGAKIMKHRGYDIICGHHGTCIPPYVGVMDKKTSNVHNRLLFAALLIRRLCVRVAPGVLLNVALISRISILQP